jgi:hypothetical protein
MSREDTKADLGQRERLEVANDALRASMGSRGAEKRSVSAVRQSQEQAPFSVLGQGRDPRGSCPRSGSATGQEARNRSANLGATRAAQRSLFVRALSPDLSRRTACYVRHSRCQSSADGDPYIPQSSKLGGADYSFVARALRLGRPELGDRRSVAFFLLDALLFVPECDFGAGLLGAAGADFSTGAGGSDA